MSELPLGWDALPLDIAATLIRGVSYKKNESSNESSDSLLPILRANNIQDGKLDLDDLVYIPADKIKDEQKVKANDIVIAMSSGSKKLVGKSGIATVDFNGGFGTFCGLLRPKKYFDARYIGHFTRSKYYADLVSSLSKGVNINNLKPAHFSEILVPIAPYNEQIRIANKLDSILAKVDKAQARLDKIPAILKRFRHSVLAAATSGELTKEWREDNQLEFHMVEKRFEKLLVELRNGISTKPNENGAGHPILRISALRAGIVTQEDVRHLECDSKIVEKYKLLPNDILFTRYNGSLDFVGVCGLLKTLRYETLLYPDKLIRARVTEEVLPEFIEIYFSSPDAREAMISHVKTTSGQKGISGKDIKNQIVRFPTLLEQKQVVSRVSALLAKANKVEKQYLDAKSRLDRLTQSILAKAFRGELVPQDPNDEPAEKLLERILAEKELNKPKKTTRKRTTKAKTAEKE
ncbi:restriction endonuclease subunit S [Vibrio parahaemolyticus]|uniref:restriction endonuclease subunit S n=1 Tax=Vibrio parahaemolyticus TaxID=670 RepID=UPI00084A7916|nr:restriction endonuclease subunit S [Vibrio parahaemolyticus]OEA11041.1 restriction endonuclease subunit S [Vibrio parahaemolyticus]